MTQKARITEADLDRTIKSLKTAGIKRARVIMHLAEGRIEVILDDPGNGQLAPNEWDRE